MNNPFRKAGPKQKVICDCPCHYDSIVRCAHCKMNDCKDDERYEP